MLQNQAALDIYPGFFKNVLRPSFDFKPCTAQTLHNLPRHKGMRTSGIKGWSVTGSAKKSGHFDK